MYSTLICSDENFLSPSCSPCLFVTTLCFCNPCQCTSATDGKQALSVKLKRKEQQVTELREATRQREEQLHNLRSICTHTYT